MNLRFRSKTIPIPLELLFWLSGLLVLGILDPFSQSLPDLCLSSLAGFDGCPGCGLGRSISFLLHGEPIRSFEAHILGPIALLIITHRIATLTKSTITIQRKEHSHA